MGLGIKKEIERQVLKGLTENFMHNVTLICTRHQELGLCNSNELLNIIEQINPELIFEELPPSYFDKYYVHKSCRNLEADTISRYVESHEIDHIPVDCDEIPSDSFFEDYRHMLGLIEGHLNIHGFNYRNLIGTNRTRIARCGFEYLNSVDSSNYWEEINDTIEKALREINSKKMLQTYNLWKIFGEKRENEMLQNIYNYSKKHSYDKAIFYVGAAHRKSIMQKIQEFEIKETFKLDWAFYNS